MRQRCPGFSLIELLVALALSMGLAAALFQLFAQGERAFRDEQLVLELRQNVRAVAFQIGNEIRKAGQGVPLFATTFDAAGSDATSAILAGSDAAHLRFRAGVSNIETTTGITGSAGYTMNSTVLLSVDDATGFSSASSPSAGGGRFVYVWGSGELDCWGWVRAELVRVDSASQMTVSPKQAGDGCREAGVDGLLNTPDDVIVFKTPQTVALEEAVLIDLDSGSIRRSTSRNMADLSNPVWGSPTELGRGFTEIHFSYFDAFGKPIDLRTISGRLRIAQIELRVSAHTGPLSRGDDRTFSLRLQVTPQNLAIMQTPE